MENNERDRKLDQWLDEALSDYSAAEPRFGLEQRVLNRIRSEELRSRKWNVWRWMPAFAAIAAVIVVAVAIRPMLEKKAPLQPFNSPIETRASDTAKSADSESPGKKAEAVTKPASQPRLQDTLHGIPSVRREVARIPQKEVVPQNGDRDRLITAEAGKIEHQLRASGSFEKKAPAVPRNNVSADGRLAAMTPPAPPPPPPVQQVQPEVIGGIAGGAVANAPVTAANEAAIDVNGIAPKSKAEAASAQPAMPALLNDKFTTESAASVLNKDSRRKEAHAKPEAREDANVMEVNGVRVRFESGPATQQFPAPVPLSNQEKLALKAGQQLKDSAAAQHKSTEITPIEIKDVEIKPLEGPDKEK